MDCKKISRRLYGAGRPITHCIGLPMVVIPMVAIVMIVRVG
jgi:hypothetical protein